LAIAVNKQYELVLMLDPDVPDERRDEIAAQTRQRIEAGGTLKHDASWGMRKLAYEIRHKGEGAYHLVLFTATPATLEELSRVLKITDGVMRHLAVRRVVGSTARPPEPTPEEPVAVAAVERQDAETESSAPESAGEETE